MSELPAVEREALGPSADEDAGLRFAIAAARIAHDHRSEDVAVIDLRGISGFTDFFVIATGTSDRQMRATADAIEQFARTLDRRPFRVAGTKDAAWIVADYIDVVLHLFDATHRDYYDLDGYWGDAPRIAWERPAAADPPLEGRG